MFNFFEGGGGFPGGHPGMGGHGRREPVDTEQLYKDLSVPKSATSAQIKKAYRKAAMKHHPDKGGDEATFKKISAAYEVLKDPEKKKIYDTHGLEGVKSGGGGGGMDPSDLFGSIFGGGGGRQRGPRKGQDVVFRLKVSLADLYNGATKKLRLSKQILCKGCDGQGGKGGSTTCTGCRGRGVRMVVRQIGPGMIQQSQARCPECDGEGVVIADADRCRECMGKRTQKVKKTLEVFINKGMKNGEKITFSGESDEAPGVLPGDVIVVLQQEAHDIFHREGAHITMKKKITLYEALVGFEFRVKHLDERILLVKSEPNTCVKPGQIKAVVDEGMPQHKNPFVKGNLYIEFTIEFPEYGMTEHKKVLKTLLPAPEAVPDMDMETEADEEVELCDIDIEAERKKFAQMHDEDSDEEGGQQASCRTA